MNGPLFLLLALLAPAPAAAPSVAVKGGDVEYRAADGTVRRITREGGCEAAALSPDGRTIAFIHVDAPGDQGTTSLWVADAATGAARRLLAPKADDRPERDLQRVHRPFFSLDGGYVYVEAEAWATSEAIHQVSVATGKERFVVDGWLYGVLRSGPWRGYLVVGQHRYWSAPDYGSYNPVSVIRPDGKVMLRVPGSDKDDGDPSLRRWLESKGWTLS
ncbi:MAG: hypothetical protein JOZ90_17020 [Alphaproteobacteria bacterium]|nr:hypothetical protein [Alphaproteobacteria bacterium]MBV9371485.1 hypothetical protein [Alphaproteobacteria bacterium]MBV9902773.1 hypothetical protein [Alphaproteobacteria bacterium]